MPMSSEMRSCAKTACRWPAAATLAYRYATRQVWLTDLAEDHPATHDLCPHHADALKVPKGWELVDQRTHTEAVHEPSAAEIVERAQRLRDRVAAIVGPPPTPRRTSRYDALLEALPQLAADHGLDEEAEPPGPTVPEAAVDDEPEDAPAQLDMLDVEGVVVPLLRARDDGESTLD